MIKLPHIHISGGKTLAMNARLPDRDSAINAREESRQTTILAGIRKTTGSMRPGNGESTARRQLLRICADSSGRLRDIFPTPPTLVFIAGR